MGEIISLEVSPRTLAHLTVVTPDRDEGLRGLVGSDQDVEERADIDVALDR